MDALKEFSSSRTASNMCHVQYNSSRRSVDLLQMTGLERIAVRAQSGHHISRIAQASWARISLLFTFGTQTKQGPQ